MFEILRKSLALGIVTTDYPATPAESSSTARGRPEIDWAAWQDPRPAARICPTGAIESSDQGMERSAGLDLGKCIFCGLCADTDPAIRLTSDCELASRDKEALRITARYRLRPDGTNERLLERSKPPSAAALSKTRACLQNEIARVLGRSLHIRHVDAGSCNGCEVEIVALNSPVYDLERLGIHFVASPRHADLLLVTGPVTRNMELALRKAYAATPNPKLVAAVGACGCSGGIFGLNYAVCGAVDQIIPVDVYIPGCPPNPYALIHGILTAVGRLEER